MSSASLVISVHSFTSHPGHLYIIIKKARVTKDQIGLDLAYRLVQNTQMIGISMKATSLNCMIWPTSI